MTTITLRFHYLSFPLVLFLALLSSCLKSPSEPVTQEPATINLSTYSVALTAISQRIRIDATVLDQNGRVVTDATIFFRSGNEKIAKVSDRGVVTAVSQGTTQITVTSGYATVTAAVSVMQQAASIEIMPDSLSLERVGQAFQLRADVKDGGGTAIPGAVVVWTSRNPAVATVLQIIDEALSSPSAYVEPPLFENRKTVKAS